MSALDDAMKQLEGAIGRLEKAVGKAPARRPESTVLAQTAAQVAARLDATIARLDRILED
jgi:ABC-type transporter Mla subunit MlaD